MGVLRVYVLLGPLLTAGGVGGGGRRGYGLRVLEYLPRTFLGTSSLASALTDFRLTSARQLRQLRRTDPHP